MRILITGVAGFIGFHVAIKLCKTKDIIHGIDNLNEYYDVNLKKSRIAHLRKHTNIKFKKIDIENTKDLEKLFKKNQYDYVIHLAAQPGVQYSLTNPDSYIKSNLIGFYSILECCRNFKIKHLVYASSSSVYGLNSKQPFSNNDNVDHPISLYAATKKSNELMAHSYSHLYNLPTTGLRFFTVYGPWGRPDMAIFKFTKAIVNNNFIEVYNNGNLKRDFTYIDDVVNSIIKIRKVIPKENKKWKKNRGSISKSSAPYAVYNVGRGKTIKLNKLIKIIEKTIGKKARIKYKGLQLGDVLSTFSNNQDLSKLIGYKPKYNIEEGLKLFYRWYSNYYK